MIVGQHQIAEWRRAQGADDVDPALGHERGGAGLDREDRIGADDAADVRVALGGVGVDAVCQLLERRLLLGKISRRGKGLPTHAGDDRSPETESGSCGSLWQDPLGLDVAVEEELVRVGTERDFLG